MLTQQEANILIAMEKTIINARALSFPSSGHRKDYDLLSTDNREKFILSVVRSGKIKPNKCSYSERYKNAIILLRIDNDGRPHINPDGQEVPCPHLHIYREGDHDRWAYPLPDSFSNSPDLIQTFIDLLNYSNVINTNNLHIIMEGGMFDDDSS
jgi:hypothetical protein